MSDKLRECPFCGDGVIIDTNDNGSYWCLCISDKCIACGPIMYSEKEATEAWNTRHQPKHETVEQWEERTGETYPDDGPVWSVLHNDMKSTKTWKLYEYKKAKNNFNVSRSIAANHHGKPGDMP